MIPSGRDLAELVRLPAALTVPGDSLSGAVAAGRPFGRRGALMPAASICLYWAGMVLNDFADRDLDKVERPERPIPSGRVRPAQALGLAAALTVAGLGLATLAAGPRMLPLTATLAGVVWAYDLVLKDTPAGPVAMATARALDVLLGAGGARAALVPAALLGAHTAGVTVLSRGEVHGSRATTAAAVTAGTVMVALATSANPRRGRPSGLATAALAGVYAWTVGRAQARAVSSPDAGTVRTATGAGIRGMIPLQAALAARGGAPAVGLGLLAMGPLAKAAARVVSPT
ncbi:MAG: SCO3242 family prenyltransferase [Nocardioides sp.]|uniref:SCO3242 family prenyltransferase n=1 Tax=Nocardioides sp. TaxID=35761 RepID=UPI0032678B94